jgi:MYXO-CTERM domain-containing protein
VTVASDEVVGPDLVIRGKDGTAHAELTPCARERYDRGGRRVAPPADDQGGTTPVLPAPIPATSIYDGYIVYYVSSGAIMPNSTLTTDWIVPPAPANVATQDIAFFNDVLTTAGGGDILQPVLDFNGESRGKWAIESEHCCLSGNDMQSTITVVAPGDLIRGIVAGTGCDTTGVCQSWTVTTTDVTSGKSTTLNTTAPNGVPNGVSPGSLETYDVSSCDMFPGGGATTFMNNTLAGPNGAVQTPRYNLINFQGVNAEVPKTCGYAGMASGNNYTLVYGKVTVGNDGGAADSGRGADASVDARTGGGTGGSGTASDGGSADRRSSDASAEHATGSSGGSGSGGAAGTGGVSGDSGGSTGSGGRLAVDAGGTPSDGSGTRGSNAGADGGCSCSTAQRSDAPGVAVLAIAGLLAFAARRGTRRSAARRRSASVPTR